MAAAAAADGAEAEAPTRQGEDAPVRVQASSVAVASEAFDPAGAATSRVRDPSAGAPTEARPEAASDVATAGGGRRRAPQADAVQALPAPVAAASNASDARGELQDAPRAGDPVRQATDAPGPVVAPLAAGDAGGACNCALFLFGTCFSSSKPLCKVARNNLGGFHVSHANDGAISRDQSRPS